MKAFEYVNPTSLSQAAQLAAVGPSKAMLMAGGVDLLGELKDRISTPERIINLKSIAGLDAIQENAQGLSLGALVTLATAAEHPGIRKHYQALAEAAESVGSVQIRNVGTVGGNLCQRPRCWYYRHLDYICLKKGGSICYAQGGENRYHAILGGGPSFIVHPSDLAPALIALEASVKISGATDEREVRLEDFYVLPTQKILQETVLERGEIVTEVRVPAPKSGTRSTYLKFREKPSFDFAIVAVAAALRMEGGTCADARVVLGGVAPKPWRSTEAEAELVGKRLDENVALKAADAALENAKPLPQNRYKVPLTRALIKRALLQLAT